MYFGVYFFEYFEYTYTRIINLRGNRYEKMYKMWC